MSAILEVADVSKRFGGVDAVKNVSFEIARGALVGLMDQRRRQNDDG